jgi:hypothetical protein
MAGTKNQSGKRMWPFADVSLEWATWWGEAANITLIICLLGGVLATFAIVRTTNVKEHHWDALREKAKKEFDQYKIDAGNKLTKEVASVRSDADAKIGVAREEAKVEVGKAQAEIAKANAQIEVAKKEAETARTEQERLKSLVVWRTLKAAGRDLLNESFKAGAGRVMIEYAMNDPEARYLAIQIANCFARTPWQAGFGSKSFNEASPFGIYIWAKDNEAGRSIKEAFVRAGIPFSTDPIRSGTATGGGMIMPDPDATIFVASRHPAQ